MAKKKRELLLRGISALCVLVILYFACRWDVRNDSGWALAGCMAVITVFGLREFYRLAVHCGVRPFTVFGVMMGPLLVLAVEFDASSHMTGLPVSAAGTVMVLAIIGTLLLQLTRKTNQGALATSGLTILGFLYCALLPSYLMRIRHLEMPGGNWAWDGMEFVIVCIFVSKVSDIGALLVGSQFGKHKLIPRLSPGKTWEGAFGGLIFSVCLLQFMVWTAPQMTLARLGGWKLVLLSVVLTVASLGGDLVESCFKRDSQLKDAGAGVPGFGGVLDLVDSLLLSVPVMYYFLLACGARSG